MNEAELKELIKHSTENYDLEFKSASRSGFQTVVLHLNTGSLKGESLVQTMF